MTIRAQTTGTTAVLEMAGSMSAREFGELHHQLVGLLQRRRTRIVLDFGGVDHVSYRDASSLAREFALVRSHNGDLRLERVSPYVRDILLLAGLSDVLDERLHDSWAPTELEHAHGLRAS